MDSLALVVYLKMTPVVSSLASSLSESTIGLINMHSLSTRGPNPAPGKWFNWPSISIETVFGERGQVARSDRTSPSSDAFCDIRLSAGSVPLRWRLFGVIWSSPISCLAFVAFPHPFENVFPRKSEDRKQEERRHEEHF